MLVRDNEVLWIAYFLSPIEAGYAKAALALINLVQMPITPFISTSYPEINRAVAKKSWKRVKQLLRRITIISGGWTLVTSIGLAILGKWLLPFAYNLPSPIPILNARMLDGRLFNPLTDIRAGAARKCLDFSLWLKAASVTKDQVRRIFGSDRMRFGPIV